MSFERELNVLRYVLFGSFDTLTTILSVLYMIGLWKLFVKCGLKGWWALVPIVKYYKLALCADREQEGRTVTVLHIVVTFVFIVNGYMERSVLFLRASGCCVHAGCSDLFCPALFRLVPGF